MNTVKSELKALGEWLKKHREEKQISLSEIGAETRINVTFLEAIEMGDFPKLPQSYLRAFLREYGNSVGIPGDQVVERYLSIIQQKPAERPYEGKAETRSMDAAQTPPSASMMPSGVLRNMIFVVVAAGILAVTYYVLSNSSQTREEVHETPFSTAVRESELATTPPKEQRTDQPIVLPPPVIDSLRLEMITLDSVWINILIDNKRGEEYLLAPRRKKIWSAKEKFSVTMGNAGGATFRLNGKELGAIGKRGAVVRNYVINHALLDRP
jgi:hypothetical protein